MQYLLSQEEYDEYMSLKYMKAKNLYTAKIKMSSSKNMVYQFYLDNPGITYKHAASLLGMQPSGVYKHIVSLEKMGYVERDTRGGVHIVKK